MGGVRQQETGQNGSPDGQAGHGLAGASSDPGRGDASGKLKWRGLEVCIGKMEADSEEGDSASKLVCVWGTAGADGKLKTDIGRGRTTGEATNRVARLYA